MADNNHVPLPNISLPQINKALSKLQLVSPVEYDVEGRVELLRCSKVFNRGLGEYSDEDIMAVFSKKGNFIDFQTADGRFDGLFSKLDSGKIAYPCRVCASEVTDKHDKSGFGLECNGCGLFFHNSCTTKPISVELFKALAGSPNYVKVLCPPCNLVYGSADHKLKRIERKVKGMSETLNQVEETVDKISKQKQLFSSVAGSTKSQSASIPPRIMKGLKELTKVSQHNEDTKHIERTRIVVRSENTNIRDSRDIRKEFNKHYNGIVIKHCRLTALGSIMFEFDDEKTAKDVEDAWSTAYFGGNKGMKVPGTNNTVGIVKYVYDDWTEEQMTEGILEHYPDAECEFFKRKSDNSFMGMIKVDFKSRETLLKVINDRIKFCNQRYIVEEFKRKSRVVKCNLCQGWGHIHRYCKKTPKCGKCAENHETKSCSITGGYKCAHCGKGHKAGSYDCKVYKEKMALFANDSHHE